MPVITDSKTGQAVGFCGKCGKVVATKEHPYAIHWLTSGNQYPKPSEAEQAFIKCPHCDLYFVACKECGGRSEAEHQKELHLQDCRSKCWGKK